LASGRIIQNKICRSKTVHDLGSWASRCGFTWYITHADRDGRVPADPAVVKAMLFPRALDIGIDDVASMIEEWHARGLIYRYEADGDVYAFFPEFEKNQPNLRYEKEAVSVIPAPAAELVRSQGGVGPELLRQKRREEKRRDKKRGEAPVSPDPEWPEGDDE
jgi:hypothetical protein